MEWRFRENHPRSLVFQNPGKTGATDNFCRSTGLARPLFIGAPVGRSQVQPVPGRHARQGLPSEAFHRAMPSTPASPTSIQRAARGRRRPALASRRPASRSGMKPESRFGGAGATCAATFAAITACHDFETELLARVEYHRPSGTPPG